MISIRLYIDSDFAQVQSLVEVFQREIADMDLKHQVRAFESPEESAAYTKQLLQDVSEREGVLYVAEENGEIKAFIQGIIDRHTADPLYKLSHVSGDHGWIGEIYVHPDVRSQGTGKILVEKMREYFKAKDCTSCRLLVMASNERAVTFYKNLGFEVRDYEMAIDL